MIADLSVRPAFARRLRTGRRHRSRPRTQVTPHASLWARFGDDRQAVRLKLILLATCVLVAALLEVSW
ncbi:MAG: hypothetical protein ACT4P5_00370 [Armatimonadota bacterium]